ncbi:hypothetical protein B0H63DRAFT_489653 [Podospora didyma]|uniref:Uncharacterized protein n=1 Tax=Podospora didyma TaxID=330526 RepID=A0AAE0K0E0_9PEZI|nr:hypothetical protein B0H63DRAFT_489653 [Podospora didyma]
MPNNDTPTPAKMDSLTAHTELMHNAVPARCIQPGGVFSAVNGANDSPLILSIGSDQNLYAVNKDATTLENVELNLSTAFKLPSGHVMHSMAVNQDPSMNIHLVFAAGPADGASNLYIVKPLACDDIQGWTPSSDLSSLVLKGSDKSDVHVSRIYVAGSAQALTTSPYPAIFVQYQKLSQSTFDFCPVIVDPTGVSWSYNHDLQSPINSQKILDLCAATINGSRSLVALTQEAVPTGVTASSTAPAAPQMRVLSLFEAGGEFTLMDIVQKCPPNSAMVRTLTNSDGNDDLLIAGGGMYFMSGSGCAQGQQGPDPQVVSSDTTYQTPQQFEVAQQGEQVSIWVRTSTQDVNYQEYQSQAGAAPLQSSTPIVPLLVHGDGGGAFSPIRTPGGVQHVLVSGIRDATPVLTQVTQNVSTRLWQPTPVMVPALSSIVKFVSFTTQVQLSDTNGIPLHGRDVMISTSVPADLIVNGMRLSTDSTGTLATADKAGTLTMILQGTDSSTPTNCPIITVAPVAGSSNTFKADDFLVNPALKMSDATTKLSSVDHLKSLQKKGVISGSVSTDNLHKAAKGFNGLKNAAASMNSQGQVVPQTSSPPSPSTPPSAPSAMAGQETTATRSHASPIFQQREAIQPVSFISAGGEIGDAFDDLWTLMKTGFEHIASWTVEQVEDGWAFILEIGGEFYNLIVKTISHIVQAAVKIFEFIEMAIEDIIKFIGFLFEWEDIVKTKNILVNITTQGMIWGADNLDAMQAASDTFFGDMKAMVLKLKTNPLPTNMQGAGVGTNSAKQQSASNEKASRVNRAKSPAASFGQYQMQHGGKSVKSQKPASSGTSPSSGGTSVTDIASAIWTDVEELISSLKTDFANYFSDPDISLDNLLENIGLDVLASIIDVTATVVSKMIQLLSQLIIQAAGAITTTIDIPVLSALYELVSGSPLTVLDAACLVMAIPMTFSYKMFMDQSPTDISGISYLTAPNLYLTQLQNKVAAMSSSSASSSPSSPAMMLASSMPSAAPPAFDPLVLLQQPTSPQPTTPSSGDNSSGECGPNDSSQFSADTSITTQLFDYGVPVASLLAFNLYTVPHWFDVDPSAPDNDIWFTITGLIWLSQATRVGGGNVPGFGWRLKRGWIGKKKVLEVSRFL